MLFQLAPRLELPHNSAEQIREELFDEKILEVIRSGLNLSRPALTNFAIVVRDSNEFWLYRSEFAHPEDYEPFIKRFTTYTEQRLDGHTREYACAVLTNQVVLAGSDQDLQALLAKVPLLPPAWVRRESSGTFTNRAGTMSGLVGWIKDGKVVTNAQSIHKVDEVVRWVSFVVVDGPVAWRYTISFRPDNFVVDLSSVRFDAHEADPDLARTFKEVRREVEHEIGGQYGPAYEALMRKKLKARGMDWYSLTDLNPGVIVH
jgi:hypothetical protein